MGRLLSINVSLPRDVAYAAGIRAHGPRDDVWRNPTPHFGSDVRRHIFRFGRLRQDHHIAASRIGPRNRVYPPAPSAVILSAESRGWYNPRWHYENKPETRAALDLIFSDHFSRYEPGIFGELRDTLLTHGDYYMHLADLKSYLEADQRLLDLYASPDEWTRKAVLNVAHSGKFSSDRTIAEYAADIWEVKPCPVL
jgi:hypothetical protein